MHSRISNFETSLKLRPEDFLKLTLCPREELETLSICGKVPKLHNPKCAISHCTNCGADKLLMDTCPICTSCEAIAKVTLWIEADRAGGKN